MKLSKRSYSPGANLWGRITKQPSAALSGILKSRKLQPSQLLEVYRTLRQKQGHRHWWPGETPFEVIIGSILTQNTAWTNVEKAIHNLKSAKQLSPYKMRAIPIGKLAQLIRPAGYFNIKADRIKCFIRFLFKQYQGSLTRMFRERGEGLREKLLSVKGIGPETADSILLYAGQKKFFVIDAYTKRIFARHRLLPFESDYAAWQALFTQSLPKKTWLYNDFHAQIVYIGKHFCRTAPLCDICPLKGYL